MNNAQQHQLITLFNQVTEKLREEKQSLYQRELLLDKVVNASDVVNALSEYLDLTIWRQGLQVVQWVWGILAPVCLELIPWKPLAKLILWPSTRCSSHGTPVP